MGILNVTPDSFSDGGKFATLDAALSRVEEMIAEGVDVIDIGGESTRPSSKRVDARTEIERTAPVIEAIAKRFDIPISIDTSKSSVAEVAVRAGAEIINDISGLRFDPLIAGVAAKHKTGLVLMHSRGEFEAMHSQPPVNDIVDEVTTGLESSITIARNNGLQTHSIVLDIGIGFGKTVEQNLELIAKLGNLAEQFSEYPMLIGVSRKSFIPKVLEREIEPQERMAASLAIAVLAVQKGAKIIRTHDVRETVGALKMYSAIDNV